MDAYQCDGCEQFFVGDAKFRLHLNAPYHELGEETEFHFDSWECVETVAARKQEERDALGP